MSERSINIGQFLKIAVNRFAVLSFLCIIGLTLAMGFALTTLLTRAVSQWEADNTAALTRRVMSATGAAGAFFAASKAPGNKGERWGKIYVPIVSQGGKRVLGIVEVYRTTDRLQAILHRGRVVIWTISLSGGGALYLVLLPLVRYTYRRKQEILLEYTAQLEHEVAERTDELRRSNAELEQFAYVASHDLQEPLRMINNYTQLLARRYKGKLDSDADEFIGFTVDAATRMRRLIQDLLTYSRVGRQPKEPEPTDCAAVFETARANLRAAIEESGAVVTADPLPTVMADPVQLGQLFQNLMGNAIKFRGEVPIKVHVRAERRGNFWQFSAQDNGIGIDPQFRDRIFVVFQRAHTRDEYPGTGIGLAVCKKIVERFGGRIWVESEPGHGSTFYFTLPVVAPTSGPTSERAK